MTSLQQTAMGGGSATAKVASYVLTAADAGTTIIMNSGSATTITVNTSLFAAGDTVFVVNQGAGVCTITAGTATVSTAGSLAMAQNETGQLYFLSTSAAIFTEYTQAAAASGGMTEIASGSLPTGASTITLSSISGSYKNLQLVIRDPYPATATSLALQFNGNTSSVYRYVSAYYGATGPISGVAVDATTLLEVSQTSLKNTDNNNLIVVDIFDYANAITNKSGRYNTNVQSDSYAQFINNASFAFNSTTAITSITIRNANAAVNFSGGTYVLYGVN
jgi:hypothetical protein